MKNRRFLLGSRQELIRRAHNKYELLVRAPAANFILFFVVWGARAPPMTSPLDRLSVLVYSIRFDHYDNGLEYESLFSYEECINSKLQERN
jgi:hypothetical protein